MWDTLVTYFTHTCRVEHQVSGNLVFTAVMKYGDYRYFQWNGKHSNIFLSNSLNTSYGNLISSSFLVAHPVSRTDSSSQYSLGHFTAALCNSQQFTVSGSSKQLQEIIHYRRDAFKGSTSLHICHFQKLPQHFWKPLPTLIARETFIRFISFVFLLGRLLWFQPKSPWDLRPLIPILSSMGSRDCFPFFSLQQSPCNRKTQGPPQSALL